MKFIVKGNEPAAWKAYRETSGVDFDAIPELKEALLSDQGYICCYCMNGIKEENMKVEHYKPRSTYPALKMEYTNLFAACKGDFCTDKHCDTKKENTELSIHPADPRNNCEAIIGYSTNGKLTYPDKYKVDIEETLNLNNSVLISNRKGALYGAALALKKIGYKSISIKKLIDQYKTKSPEGKFQPYCNTVLWLLNKKLSAN
ncbi:retron system putative HNH endonuclease [Marivirga sp.]|uniref:retron system putative HNH endonuclease n=1 Tax=Marivirga sp. TaxID=2018662 RepID=UPI002D7FD2F1|nr:retron system putative HNH endonuclease [Marivirga sp.]HET8861249.1 retron system putative HNH endonuclease [Marivirga sp.]